MITIQILNADDAVEDWADIIPEEVAKLREQAASGSRRLFSDDIPEVAAKLGEQAESRDRRLSNE